MRVPDDYLDEMERLSSEQVEAILSGGLPEDETPARAASAVARVRESLLQDPAPDIAARHLAAMAAARPDGRGAAEAPGGKSEMRKKSRRRVGGLALVAALVLSVGVAAAVTLPQQANEKAQSVVPEQVPPPNAGAEAEEASAHGKAVSELAGDPSLSGCEKGQAVSALASSKAEERRGDEPERPDPCTRANGDDDGDEGEGADDVGEKAAARGSGAGAGSGGAGSGGGGGGGGSATGGGGGSGSGGSGSGGGGGGGGSATGGGSGSGSGGGGGGGGSATGGGGGSGGQGAGSGSGGSTTAPGGPPDGIPTP